jgi:hypothetical protein
MRAVAADRKRAQQMANHPLPSGTPGRELRRTLLQGEVVLAHASGKAGSLLVATDRRAIIIKTGIATDTWFGKNNAAFGSGHMTSVDLHTGVMDGSVEISAGGVQNRTRARYDQLVHADTICPFNLVERVAVPPGRGGHSLAPVCATGTRARTAAAGRFTSLTRTAPHSIPDQIAALAQVHQSGALSTAEFEAKKAELLSRM